MEKQNIKALKHKINEQKGSKEIFLNKWDVLIFVKHIFIHDNRKVWKLNKLALSHGYKRLNGMS